jgi:hypothetical protein
MAHRLLAVTSTQWAQIFSDTSSGSRAVALSVLACESGVAKDGEDAEMMVEDETEIGATIEEGEGELELELELELDEAEDEEEEGTRRCVVATVFCLETCTRMLGSLSHPWMHTSERARRRVVLSSRFALSRRTKPPDGSWPLRWCA